MLHLLLWDVTDSQDEYSNYLLVLSPIGSACGACGGLFLSLHSGDFLFIAAVSSFFSILFLVVILNTHATYTYLKGDLVKNEPPLDPPPPLIPSIRMIANSFEFKRVFKVSVAHFVPLKCNCFAKNIILLDFSLALLAR